MATKKKTEKKLFKSKKDKIIFGICGGIAEYLGVDSTIVRLIAVVLMIFGHIPVILLYLVLAFLIPESN